MLKTDKTSMELQRMFKVDGENLTDRYQVIYYKGNYEIFDTSLNEVVFAGKSYEVKSFIVGFVVGRTTIG